MDPFVTRAFSALGQLDEWVQARKLAGYDPYDLRGTDLYLWALNPAYRHSLPRKVLRGGLSVLENLFPMGLRSLFGVRPEVNAKAIALFARAYLDLYAAGYGDGYLTKANACLDWLEAAPTHEYTGAGWGYPFHWQSVVFIPKGTPSSVVSWHVGDAFWRAYQLSGERRHLDICIAVCEFFRNGLNSDRPTADSLCFSYTPLDKMHVFNSTLFVGEFLIRIGREIENSDYQRDGFAVAEYVVSNQLANGSWTYFGPEEKRPPTVDHYHTGFVLRMLHSISEMTSEQRFEQSLAKGFRFYWNALFEPDGLPRYFSDRVYPVNIHTLSEALLCLRLFDGRYRDTSDRLIGVFEWTMDNMHDRQGYFYFAKYPNRLVKMPYLRWGQAWMLLALTKLVVGNTQREHLG